MNVFNQLPLDILLQVLIANLPSADLVPLLGVSPLLRNAAAIRLNTITPIVINGTRNLVFFLRALEAGIIYNTQSRHLELHSVRPAHPELITPIFFQLMRRLPALRVHFSQVDLIQLFPQDTLDNVLGRVGNPISFTMDTRNTDAAMRIHFMRLCCYYNDTLQELDVRGLTDAVYRDVLYYFGDLPSLLRADFQHITHLTLHFSMGRRLSLYRVMNALPHLQRLDLHNMTRGNRRRAFFNATFLHSDLRGFPLQVLRIHIRDLTAILMDSIQLELRQLQSITIHGSSTLLQFAREAGQIIRAHERALAMNRLNPDHNPLAAYTVLNTSLTSLTFEHNLHVNLYVQHVHRIFPRVTRLRLHNCGMRGRGSLNAGAWNLQSFELDITNIRPQTIQVNTGTNARGFRLHGGRYIAIGPNEAFVPDLRVSALTLQQFVIYSAGLNQIFIIDHP